MKKLYLIVCVFAAGLLSINVTYAAGHTNAVTITGFSAIYNFQGKPEFELYGTWNNIDSCSASSLWVVGRTVDETPDTVKAKYSMIMSAYISGKTVSLYVDGCGEYGGALVKHVYMPSR